MTAVRRHHGPTLPGALAGLATVLAIVGAGWLGWASLFARIACR